MDKWDQASSASASDGSPPIPPHAPTARRASDAPLDAVERVVADHASHIGDEETWEYYSQVEDDVALDHARWTLAGRLANAQGSSVRVELDGEHPSGATVVIGQLVGSGVGWLMIQSPGQETIVNVASVVSVSTDTGVGGQLPPPATDGLPLLSWPSAIRNHAQRGRVVVIHRVAGAPVLGSILRAAGDHLEVAATPTSTSLDLRGLVVAMPYSAIIRIDVS